MTEIEKEVSEAMAADPNYPLGETDALKWAVAWRLFRDRNGINAMASNAPGEDIDGWMVGWFANAMASAHPTIIMQRPGFIVVPAPEALVEPREGMRRYIGTKAVNARPMTRLAYNELRGWQLPADEDGGDAGYLVEYADGQRPNVVGYQGYVSWSPADVFERSYR